MMINDGYKFQVSSLCCLCWLAGPGDCLVGGSSVGTSKSRTGTGNGTGNGQYAKTGNLGPGNDTSVPGPLLRRAVSATVKEGIVREKKNQRVESTRKRFTTNPEEE